MAFTEVDYLILVTLFSATMWIPYIINRILEMGLWKALKQPQAEEPPKALWAKRAVRAHMNAIENLVIFAPLVLAIAHLGLQSEATTALCFYFFVLRVAHYFSYLFAIPLARTLLFVLGWMIQINLGWIVLGAAG